MKKHVSRYLAISVFAIVLAGIPLQLFHVNSVNSAYAIGWRPNLPPRRPEPPYVPSPTPVPEPATLSLLGAGIAGVAVYIYVRRRNRK
jgi:hypothetical protein